MDWKEYEREIHEFFEHAYPDAQVLFNQVIVGKYSKVERQIDVLVEEKIEGQKIRTIVDGKYYRSNIDVKGVETFIAMVEDVEAQRGILITPKGYSPAAMNRAYYGPSDIELDILNFEELKDLQGFVAIPYAGSHGVIMPAPFGWVIDATKREGFIATAYQRGKTFVKAAKSHEFLYVQIWDFDRVASNLDELISLQEKRTKEINPNATFHYHAFVQRVDNAKTILRVIDRGDPSLVEYTGFIAFKDFCLFCVLFTPEQLSIKNLRKLKYIGQHIRPIMVDQSDKLRANIQEADRALEATDDLAEQAAILIYQGDQYANHKQYENALERYNESIKALKTSYGALKGKIKVLILMNLPTAELDNAINGFCELGPTNPQVPSDLTEILLEHRYDDYLIHTLNRKIDDYQNSFEAQGNFHFALGLLYQHFADISKAKFHFIEAKICFNKSLPSDHYVFKSLKVILNKMQIDL